MIRLSFLYSSAEVAPFDHDYFRDTHVPMAAATWGLSSAEVDRGIDGPYIAAAHFRFDTADDMRKALAVEGTADVHADIINYTTITPIRQVSEIE